MPENVGALWALVDEEGFTAEYIARFTESVVVHRDELRSALAEYSPKERQAFLDEVWERSQQTGTE